MISIPPARLVVLFVLFAGGIAAQAPVIPAGWMLVDDLILQEDFFTADAAYTSNAWLGGIVPYEFDPAVTVPNQVYAKTAMAEIAAVANVTFIPKTNEIHYISFTNCGCNASYLGQSGGGQPIYLYNWNVKYIICHELMHALGYIHEQCRPDRDTYVIINPQNMTAGAAGQFYIAPGAIVTGPYDFLSIMHYGAGFFSNGGGPTITCQPTYAQYQGQMGNQGYMTLLDAQGIATRYGQPLPPRITAISPDFVTTSSAAFTMTITGLRFLEGANGSPGVQGSRVRFDGGLVGSSYVNPTTLSASIPASLLVTSGCHVITVENPFPGGGLSNPFNFAVGLNTCAPNVEWQVNSLASSIDYDGVQVTNPLGPKALVQRAFSTLVGLNVRSTSTGLPYELAASLVPSIPFSQSQIYTTGDQVVNLAFGSSFFFLNSGSQVPAFLPFPGNYTLSYTTPPVPMNISSQMLVTAPAHPDGVAFSQAVQLDARDTNPCSAGLALTLTDDSFSQQALGFSYHHYGTSYTQVFVGSNGRLTFNVGTLSPSVTTTYFYVGPPAIAPLLVDLNPGAGGLIRFFSDNYGSFGACYQNVPNKNAATLNSFTINAVDRARVVFDYPSAQTTSGLVGMTSGAAAAPLLLLDLSNGPHVIPAGRSPYESFTGNFDLSTRTLTFLLDLNGAPISVN